MRVPANDVLAECLLFLWWDEGDETSSLLTSPHWFGGLMMMGRHGLDQASHLSCWCCCCHSFDMREMRGLTSGLRTPASPPKKNLWVTTAHNNKSFMRYNSCGIQITIMFTMEGFAFWFGFWLCQMTEWQDTSSSLLLQERQRQGQIGENHNSPDPEPNWAVI